MSLSLPIIALSNNASGIITASINGIIIDTPNVSKIDPTKTIIIKHTAFFFCFFDII